MEKKYNFQIILFLSALLFIISSCKKDKMTEKTATPVKIGIFEQDSSISKHLLIEVSKVGTQSLNVGLIFDTGSGGMVLGADGIVPKSMITSTGFNFTGDSTVVNGITITNQTSMIEYGNDEATFTKVYGNLAYAPVTIGDANGNVVIKRLAFFLYYKGINADGSKADPHEFDIFGADPEYDMVFANGANIASPFSSYNPGTGLARGFKMAALDTTNFKVEPNYVPAVITVGLTPADVASTAFTMHSLSPQGSHGYSPLIQSTVTYNGKTISALSIFDSGNEPYSYIEDNTVGQSLELLPTGSLVKVSTSSGFNYTYTTENDENLTYVERPASNSVTIFGLEFFLFNEYMLNYDNHTIGLKNN